MIWAIHSGSSRTMIRHGQAAGMWSTEMKVSENPSFAKMTTGRGWRSKRTSPALSCRVPPSSVPGSIRAV